MAKSVPKALIKTPSDEEAVRQGCYVDEEAALRVKRFFEGALRHSKGLCPGEPFKLLPWQWNDVVLPLYGWKNADGTRRFREGAIFVPKKNGKTSKIAALSLYHFFADGEASPEVYFAGTDRDSAGLAFGQAEEFILSSPYLKTKKLSFQSSRKRIVDPATNGLLRALSSEAGGTEGISASFTAVDELHAHKSPDLYRALKFAGAARKQPLLLSISTAGDNRAGVGYAQYEYAKDLISGKKIDPSFFPLIFEAQPDDDFDDPRVWRKANPSLGHTFTEDEFRRAWNEAKQRPSELTSFLRYRLGIWASLDARTFLDFAKWSKCSGRSEDFAGRPCFAGLDLSTTTDLSALVLLFPDPESGIVDVVCKAFAPEDTAEVAQRRDKVPYLDWARSGYLTLTPGETVDYSLIYQAVIQAQAEYDLRLLAADPWNASHLLQQLDVAGVPVRRLPQVIGQLSGPTKELERLVVSGRLRHGGNPILGWNAQNAVAQQDASGNVRLSKAKSRARIDVLAALVDAIAAWMATDDAEPISVADLAPIWL